MGKRSSMNWLPLPLSLYFLLFPLFAPLQPHWLLWWSLNVRGMAPSQGLSTCCFFCVQCFFLAICMAFCLSIFLSWLKCSFPCESMPACPIWNGSRQPQYSFYPASLVNFFHSSYHFVFYDIFTLFLVSLLIECKFQQNRDLVCCVRCCSLGSRCSTWHLEGYWKIMIISIIMQIQQ